MASPIPHNWEVPQVFRDRLGARAGKQRAMAADGHLLLILHDLPTPDPRGTTKARLFWRRPDGTWAAQGSGAASIGPLRGLVDEYTSAVDALEDRMARTRRATDWFALLADAAPLMRAVRNQSATLQQARELVKNDKDLITLRDAAQDNERAMELVTTHARAGLDYSIAASAEDSARNSEHVLASQHRLNLIAATFLPISALGALLGMNLPNGLEHWSSPYLFWFAAAGAFLLGFVVRATLPGARRSDA